VMVVQSQLEAVGHRRWSRVLMQLLPGSKARTQHEN
jgi:hypothetical protein